MHTVVVVDPTFGPWFRAYRYAGEYQPHIDVGPLFEYVFRPELLRNVGKTYRDGDVIEKPCQHVWAEGSVSGNSSLPPHPSEWWWYHWSTAQNYSYAYSEPEPPPDPDGSPAKWTSHWTMNMSRSETKDTLRLKIEYKEGFLHNENSATPGLFELTTEHCFDGVAVFVASVDPLTQSVTYTFLNIEAIDSPEAHGNLSVGPCGYPFGATGGEPINVKSVFSFLTEMISRGLDVKKDGTARDEALYDALNSMQIADINSLNELEPFLAPLAPLRQLRDLLKVDSFMDVIRSAASIHLMWKYVVKTGLFSMKQLHQMMDALAGGRSKLMSKLASKKLVGRGQSKRVASDGGTSITVRHNVKVRYGIDISSFDGLLDVMNLIGLTPRLADLWDIIPYSFVLDWILPIGDALNNLELNNIQQRMNFISMIYTVKSITTIDEHVDIGGTTFHVKLTICSYQRTILDEFPRDVWFGIGLHDPRRQLLTGGALLIQAIK